MTTMSETDMYYGEALAWIRELEAFIGENGLEVPTWADREAVGLQPRPEPIMAYHNMGDNGIVTVPLENSLQACRYGTKQRFDTRRLANTGARLIRHAKGHAYQTLYPYLCPDSPPQHWHLSHHRQGYATCKRCERRVPAWFTGEVWIIGAHDNCDGEGSHA